MLNLRGITQRYEFWLLFIICIQTTNATAKSLLIGGARFYQYGLPIQSWTIEFYEDGHIVVDELIELLGDNEKSISKLDQFDRDSFCSKLKDLGAFSLPYEVDSKSKMLDGPEFSFSFTCPGFYISTELSVVNGKSDLTENERVEVSRFIQVWNFVWSFTDANPPAIPGSK